MELRHGLNWTGAVQLLVLAMGLHAQGGERTWTSADGSKTFAGELRSYDPGSGHVTVLVDGEAISFKQEALSKADIAFLKKNQPKVNVGPRLIKGADGLGESDGVFTYEDYNDRLARRAAADRARIQAKRDKREAEREKKRKKKNSNKKRITVTTSEADRRKAQESGLEWLNRVNGSQ